MPENIGLSSQQPEELELSLGHCDSVGGEDIAFAVFVEKVRFEVR